MSLRLFNIRIVFITIPRPGHPISDVLDSEVSTSRKKKGKRHHHIKILKLFSGFTKIFYHALMLVLVAGWFRAPLSRQSGPLFLHRWWWWWWKRYIAVAGVASYYISTAFSVTWYWMQHAGTYLLWCILSMRIWGNNLNFSMGAIEIVCKSGMEEAKWHKGKGAYFKCARSLLDLFRPLPH